MYYLYRIGNYRLSVPNPFYRPKLRLYAECTLLFSFRNTLYLQMEIYNIESILNLFRIGSSKHRLGRWQWLARSIALNISIQRVYGVFFPQYHRCWSLYALHSTNELVDLTTLLAIEASETAFI